MMTLEEYEEISFRQGVKKVLIFAGACISVSLLVVAIIFLIEKTGNSSAEYCAEELVSRKPVNGRLVESRICKSWVGWPIEISEVKQ